MMDWESLRDTALHCTACHLDTDEANAAGCSGEGYGEVIL